jgi:hypothetical protein
VASTGPGSVDEQALMCAGVIACGHLVVGTGGADFAVITVGLSMKAIRRRWGR